MAGLIDFSFGTSSLKLHDEFNYDPNFEIGVQLNLNPLWNLDGESSYAHKIAVNTQFYFATELYSTNSNSKHFAAGLRIPFWIGDFGATQLLDTKEYSLTRSSANVDLSAYMPAWSDNPLLRLGVVFDIGPGLLNHHDQQLDGGPIATIGVYGLVDCVNPDRSALMVNLELKIPLGAILAWGAYAGDRKAHNEWLKHQDE